MTGNSFYLTVEPSSYVKHVTNKLNAIILTSGIYFPNQGEEKLMELSIKKKICDLYFIILSWIFTKSRIL